MTFLDFFAGIGTIRIGFEQAGWTCNGHVEWDKFAQASYNAMHDIKEGEFCGWDIRAVRADELPRSELWTFGAPCQDFSIAGKRKGMDGERSSLVNEIFRLIEETAEENRPTWLLYENVKGMLSSNGGWDFLGILLEMDRIGYDVEWQLLNSKHFGVPQNRERVFTIGHLRTTGTRKVFPITGQGEQAAGDIKVLGRLNLPGKDQCNRIYSVDHLSPSLTTMQGGRQEPKIAIPVLTPDRAEKRQNGRRFKEDGDSSKATVIEDFYKDREPRCYEEEAPTLRSSHDTLKVCVEDRKYERMTKQAIETYNANSCENGDIIQPFNRKVIKDGISPTLTTRPEGFKTAILPIQNFRIRKLTPKECWRLQGIPDHNFDKAKAVNSDSQLYKQAGNACTVNVMYEIAKRMRYD